MTYIAANVRPFISFALPTDTSSETHGVIRSYRYYPNVYRIHLRSGNNGYHNVVINAITRVTMRFVAYAA